MLECCLYQNEKMARIHAAVVMPEHVHLIVTPKLDGAGGPYAVLEIMQNIKSISAHRVNRLLKRKGGVWLRESFDHVLRSSEKLEERIEYVRQNPVRRGLCNAPEEYRWLWVNPELFHG